MKIYHKNPRIITKQQYTDLEAWLDELGDLSGIVHDLNSNEIPAGNQRSRVFGLIKDEGNIVITEMLDEPTRQGTVARGYIEWHGEKYNYRQVRWTPKQCEKANIIANKAGGSFDWDMLGNQFEVDDLLEWGFQHWELGGAGEGDNVDELWQGMPEFGQDDFSPHRTLNVHFANDEDAMAFAELVGQKLTDKTKYIWYPKMERANLESLRYTDDS